MNSEIIHDIDSMIENLKNLKEKIASNAPMPVTDRPGWKKQGRFTYRFTPKNGGKNKQTKRRK